MFKLNLPENPFRGQTKFKGEAIKYWLGMRLVDPMTFQLHPEEPQLRMSLWGKKTDVEVYQVVKTQEEQKQRIKWKRFLLLTFLSLGLYLVVVLLNNKKQPDKTHYLLDTSEGEYHIEVTDPRAILQFDKLMKRLD